MNPVIARLIEFYDASVQLERVRGKRSPVTDLEVRSGFDRTAINRWRNRKNSAHIDTVCAVGTALGYRLVWEKIEPNPGAGKQK